MTVGPDRPGGETWHLEARYFQLLPPGSADVHAGAAASSSLSQCWRGEVGGPQASLQHGPGYSSAAGHPKRHPSVGTQREGPVEM